jgi:hypothetical protein
MIVRGFDNGCTIPPISQRVTLVISFPSSVRCSVAVGGLCRPTEMTGIPRGTRDRPTKTGQSPKERHSQAGAWERNEGKSPHRDGLISVAGA